MIFPPEIWEQIFVYVDPVTLTNLKTICKCWNEIIDKILEHSELWYKLCQDEIPKPFWSTLCETLCPNKFYTNFNAKDDAKFWMAMYKLWAKCKNIVKCETETKCVEPLLTNHSSEYITCADTSGNLLAVGTSEGFIYFYDISSLDRRAKHVFDHMEYIRNVQLHRDGANIVCVSGSTNGHICFWDVGKLLLIDKGFGKLICTSYSYCYYAMRNVIRIKGPVPRTMFEFSQDNIIAVGADNNKVLFYTDGGYCVRLTLDTNERYFTYVRVQPPNIRIRRYYIFKPDVFVCITENGYIGFLVQGKEWKLHNVFPVLHGEPTAVLVYARVLILGLDSGNVHIYHIDDFGAINFNISDSKKLTLDTTAVISLNIMVNVEQFLIVTYRTKIYIVKLT